MATVTGEWDGKPIELNDAATETTLKALLDAVKKGGTGSGGSGGSGGGSGGDETAKKLEELSNSGDAASDSLDDTSDAADNLSGSLWGATKRIGGAFADLTTEFLVGGDSLSDFSQHFASLANEIPIIGGLLGGALQTVTGLLDSQIDNYRELSNAGVSFGSSLFDAQRAAANTNLTLDQFSSVITNNSAAMAAIGGTAGAGAKVFTNISKIMKEDFGTQFQALGIQAAEQAEYTAGYLETLARTGRLNRMTSQQQAAGAASYIKQLDKLAKATGKQRDEIEADLQSQSSDRRFALIMQTLDEDVRQQLTGTFTYATQKLGPEFGDALKDVVATGGVPLTEMGEELMRTNPELGRMAIAVREGRATHEDFESAVGEAIERTGQMSEANRTQYGIMQAQGEVYGSVALALNAAGQAGNALATAQNEQQDQIDKGSEGLLGFSARLTDLRNQIIGKLIDSGVFDKLETVFNDVVSYFTTGGGFDAITSALDTFGTWVEGFFSDMKDAEDPMSFITDKIKGWWKDVDIGGMIWDFMFGGGNDDGAAGADGAEGTDGANGSVSVEGPKDQGGGFFDSISDSLGTFGSILAVGGTVYAAVKGFQLLLGGFGTGPVALGAAVFTGMLIGTGAAIALAGKGISMAGDGVEKVAAGIERMANLENVANFTEVAGSLGLLGPALISLTAGGVMDSIASFFGAESPFDKLVDGVNRFASIDPTAVANMTSAGTALTAFSGLTDELDGSKIEKYAEAVEKLADAMDELNESLSEDNKGAFGGGTGVSAASMLNNGTLGGGGSGSGSSEQLDRLNSTMEAVLRAINETSRREVTAISGIGNSVY